MIVKLLNDRPLVFIAFTRPDRIQQVFKLKTPGKNDIDIKKTLMAERKKRKNHSHSKSTQKQIRKKIYDLCRNCDQMSRRSKKEQQEFEYEKLCQFLEYNEFDTTYKLGRACL